MVSAETTRGYDGLKVFSVTKAAQRLRLGEEITAWLRSHPECVPVCALVRQSSDAEFHCLSILIFWRWANDTDL
jgi:hypothetical protein